MAGGRKVRRAKIAKHKRKKKRRVTAGKKTKVRRGGIPGALEKFNAKRMKKLWGNVRDVVDKAAKDIRKRSGKAGDEVRKGADDVRKGIKKLLR